MILLKGKGIHSTGRTGEQHNGFTASKGGHFVAVDILCYIYLYISPLAEWRAPGGCDLARAFIWRCLFACVLAFCRLP